MSSGPPWCTTAARCCGFRSSSRAWVMRAVIRPRRWARSKPEIYVAWPKRRRCHRRQARPRGAWAGGRSFVGYQGLGAPGEGLLLEEGGIPEPAVQIAGQADQAGQDGDHERAADLPVDPRHRPHRVVVLGGDVVVETHAPAAEEEQDQAAEDRDDALHPQIARAGGEIPP